MKEFNLEEARAGKPVCLNTGEEARIIYYNRQSRDNYPIVVLIKDGCGNEHTKVSTLSGELAISNDKLVMAPTKHEGWVNIHQDYSLSGIYDSKTQAEIFRSQKTIATVKIEWEE